MQWNLSTIHKDFDQSFQQDTTRIEELIAKLNTLASEAFHADSQPQASTVSEYLHLLEDLTILRDKCACYAQLRLSTNTSDADALAAYENIERMGTRMATPNSMFEKRLGTIVDLDTFIGDDPYLNEHRFILSETIAHSKHVLSDKEESILAQMAMTGSSAWGLLWEKITSTVEVDYEDENGKRILTLPEVRNMAYGPDAATRERAYHAELAAYPKIDASAAACMNGIKGEVITVTALRGYESPMARTLEDSRLSRSALDSMLASIRSYLPDFRRYFNAKAKLLGKERLPFHDLFAPVGEARHYTYDEAKSFIVEHFGTFNPDMAKFAQQAFDNEWIDVLPKKGKVGGAFCYPVYSAKESRILLNFSGDLGAVTTLAHELGHGYHNVQLYKASALNNQVPMVLAETASNFCETLVADALISKGGEDAFIMLETSLQGSSQVCVDILSRYLFESKVFEERKSHSLSVEEFNEAMLEAQRATYGDAMEDDKRHPYMWLCKPHYYSANESFYNYPYAFGMLFAKGLYSQYLKEGASFLPKYDKMLEFSGQNSVSEVCRQMGINIEGPDFWNASLELVRKEIDQFVAMVDERVGK